MNIFIYFYFHGITLTIKFIIIKNMLILIKKLVMVLNILLIFMI